MRKLRLSIGIIAALVVCWFVFATISIAFPSQGELAPDTDAVVSLSPPFYRLPFAEQVVENSATDVLAISYVPSFDVMNAELDLEHGASIVTYCEHDARQDTFCFTPEELSTLGETRAINAVAEQRSWEEITVVTSRYHAFRTRFLLHRCLDDSLEVNLVFPETEMSAERWGWHLTYENFAFFKAVYDVASGC